MRSRIGSLVVFLFAASGVAAALWSLAEVAVQLDRARRARDAAPADREFPEHWRPSAKGAATLCATEKTTLPLQFCSAPPAASPGAAVEALAEVNALRRARGLRPFVFDEALTRGALNVARFRAERLIEGHTRNDFAGLPRGVRADAAGCAAWRGNDWDSCCTYENYRFAGAAWCRGRDGRRYMHLFVRR